MNIVVDSESKIPEFERLRNKGPVIVWYYADWCGHCTDFDPAWNEYTNKCSNNKINISNAKVNHNIIEKLSYSPEVQGYPTIQFHHKGKNLSEFNENRTPEELMKFAKGNLKNIPKSKKASKKKSKKRRRSSSRSRNNKNKRSKKRKQ